MIQGIDTSHFDPAINWAQAKGAGIQFMYTKATQGKDFVDPSLKMHTGGASAAGVLTGAYHFFMANVPGGMQAQLFLQTVRGMKFNLPFILDWEDGSVQGQTSAQQINQAMTILIQMEQVSGRPPMIYMGENLAMSLNLPQVFSKYPLIIARYSNNMPIIPPPWSAVTMWQYTDSASILGVRAGHTVDANWFLGSNADLMALTNQTV